MKDMRTEARTRYAAYSMLLFCVTTTFMSAFATGGEIRNARIEAALLWIILFFAAMVGLARSFIKEEESGTLTLLRCAAQPGPLFYGKALFNLALLAAAAVITCPIFCAMLHVDTGNTALFTAVVAAATLSLAPLCTMVSALVSLARGRGTLFPVLAFPVLAPALLVAARATAAAFEGASFADQKHSLIFLVSYSVVAAIVSGFLFEFVFED